MEPALAEPPPWIREAIDQHEGTLTRFAARIVGARERARERTTEADDIAVADPLDCPRMPAGPAAPARAPVETLPEPLRRQRDERRSETILDAWSH